MNILVKYGKWQYKVKSNVIKCASQNKMTKKVLQSAKTQLSLLHLYGHV